MTSVNLQAVNAYTKTVSTQQTSQINDEAVTFQQMMKTNLAKMSDLVKVNQVSASQVNTTAAASNPSSIIGMLKKALLDQEKVSLDSLTGDASTLDVVIASTEAKNTLDTIVKIRSAMQDSLDKILNMSI
jgi:flagellar hook-basal body complex protein FliE